MVHVDSPSPDSFWRHAIVFCFHFLLLVCPLFFTWLNDELFEFNKMILTYIVTVSISVLWICRMIAEKKVFIRRTVFDLPILLFLGSQIVSTLFSVDAHTSFFGYYTRFNGGLLSFFCYVILFYAFISNVEKQDLGNLARTTFFSTILVSLMAIPEHFGHSLSCLMINLYRYNGQELPPNWFNQFYDASCWVQDVKTRVFASFGQPNWLAAYAILLIPVGIVLSTAGQVFGQVKASILGGKWFYALSTILLLLSLVFTKSRSGTLGFAASLAILGVGFIVAFIHYQRQKMVIEPRQKKWWQQFRTMTIVMAILFLLSLGIFGSTFSKNYGEIWLFRESVPSTISAPQPASPSTESSLNRLEIGGTDSGDIRRIVWSGAIKVWQRYPLFGSGLETFAYSYYKDRPLEHNLVSEWDFLYNKAHNEFLNFLATTGLLGLATYVVLVATLTFYPLWFVWQKVLRPYQQSQTVSTIADSQQILFSFALSAGLVALSISNFFGFSTVMVNILLFLLPGFFVVMYLPVQWRTWNFAENSSEASSSKEDELPFLAQISYVIVFCVGFAVIFSIISLWRADYLYNRGKQYLLLGQAGNGLQDLQAAIQISPGEATFYDDLASTYSRVAIALAQQGDATSAAQYATQAMNTADTMVQLSPANVNLHKSSSKVYMNLAQLEPQLLSTAKVHLERTIGLAPTDPKLRYFLALVKLAMGDTPAGIADLEKTIQMKPNYQIARLSLGEQYEKTGQKEQAKAEYEYILRYIQPNDADATQRLASLSAQMRR